MTNRKERRWQTKRNETYGTYGTYGRKKKRKRIFT